MSFSKPTLTLGLLGICLGVSHLRAEDRPQPQATEGVSTTAVAPSTESSAPPASPAVTPAPVPAVTPAPVPQPVAPIRLMSAEKDARLRKYFPEVADKELAAILKDPHLILYTEAEMPKAYQFWDGAFPGVHAVSYNISANQSEPHGNGNIEFPWGAPAGLHRTPRTFAFRFLRLPRDVADRPLPIVWHNHANGGYSWTFPIGTVFGEVLALQDAQGLGYTFEVRIRRREAGDWFADAFRPFPEAKDLAERVKELAPDWKDRPATAELVSHLEKPLALPEQYLADTQPQEPVFRQKMGVDALPPVGDDKLTARLLLETPFKSAQGKIWRTSHGNGKVYTAAPTTPASFHIVPQNYEGGFVDVDSASCMRCHDSTDKNVDRFDSRRDWYGRVRGSDGIFSFHPFEPSGISGNGYSSNTGFRERLVSGGILQRFNQVTHPRTLYQTLRTK